VLARLDGVHARVLPSIEAAAAQVGDTAWLIRPLIHHTVWFELHENLIGAIGMTREEARDPVTHSGVHSAVSSSLTHASMSA
jgi:hypothetical protein